MKMTLDEQRKHWKDLMRRLDARDSSALEELIAIWRAQDAETITRVKAEGKTPLPGRDIGRR